jgi:hypothetical protein
VNFDDCGFKIPCRAILSYCRGCLCTSKRYVIKGILICTTHNSRSFLTIILRQVYNVNLKQAAWFSAIPWAVMAMSGYVAGASADFLIKSGFPIGLVRKIMQVKALAEIWLGFALLTCTT